MDETSAPEPEGPRPPEEREGSEPMVELTVDTIPASLGYKESGELAQIRKEWVEAALVAQALGRRYQETAQEQIVAQAPSAVAIAELDVALAVQMANIRRDGGASAAQLLEDLYAALTSANNLELTGVAAALREARAELKEEQGY